MGTFNIFYIIAHTYLLFLKIYSFENVQLNKEYQMEQAFKNALNSVLDYCNSKYELEETMYNYVKIKSPSNYLENINFTTSFCQLVGKKITSVPGIEGDFYDIKYPANWNQFHFIRKMFIISIYMINQFRY